MTAKLSLRDIERAAVRQLLTHAARYYHSCLIPEMRAEIGELYGLRDATIDRFLIGYSDGKLLQHFRSEGIEEEDALSTGLFVSFDNGDIVDFFRQRIVFPYFDHDEVFYFIGRETHWTPKGRRENGKYKKLQTNTAKRPYVSTTVRNGIFNAEVARDAADLLITEGITDALAAIQAGIDCISPVTTKFSKKDAKNLIALTRPGQSIVICNDEEETGAGLDGARRTAGDLHAAGRDVRIARLPRSEGVEKIDVADFLRTHPPEEFARILDEAPPYAPAGRKQRTHAPASAAAAQPAIPEALRAKLQRCKKPESRALMAKLLAGESIAERGRDGGEGRDHALYRACCVAVYVDADEHTIDELASCFEPLARLWSSEPDAEKSFDEEMTKVRDKLRRARENWLDQNDPVRLIEAVPADTDPKALGSELRPALTRIAKAPPIDKERYLNVIKERFGINLGALRDEIATLPSADKTTDSAPLRGAVDEDENAYWIPGEEPEKISSFVLRPTKRIITARDEIVIADAITDAGSTHRGLRFRSAAFNSRRQFLEVLTHSDLQFTGLDANVQGVLRQLSSTELEACAGTEVAGYVELATGRRWVTPEQTLLPASETEAEKGGGDPEDVEQRDILYVENGSTFPNRVRYPRSTDSEVRALAAEVLPALAQLNTAAVMLTLIGWFFATPFKPRIVQRLGHFPILMIWGTQGSGKTSLVRYVLWPLFGVADSEPHSATETMFAMVKLFSSTNAIPIFVDEYRPSDMNQKELDRLHRFLRRLYGGEVEGRGRRDLTVTEYPLVAPVCVAGEARPSDAALADRLVSACPSKNHLANHPECVEAFRMVREQRLPLLAGPYIRFALQQEVREPLDMAAEATERLLATNPKTGHVSARCRDNLRVVLFGIEMFRRFAEAMDVRLPDFDLAAPINSSIADLMDGDTGAKNLLDEFLETCAVLAHGGDLQENVHYAEIDGRLCIHVASCWEIYLERCARTRRPVPDRDTRALRKLINENHGRDNGYVADTSKSVSLDRHRLRTVAIDVRRASAFLDLDGFAVRERRSHGGSRRGDEQPGRSEAQEHAARTARSQHDGGESGSEDE